MNKEEYNFEKAKQGPVVKPSPGKTRITIRVDTDILNWFRKQVHKRGGGNYQTLINDALREYTNLKDLKGARNTTGLIKHVHFFPNCRAL